MRTTAVDIHEITDWGKGTGCAPARPPFEHESGGHRQRRQGNGPQSDATDPFTHDVYR
jgi:hypothetical protein